jgi:two-component system, sensor histidine kinase and response regulator
MLNIRVCLVLACIQFPCIAQDTSAINALLRKLDPLAVDTVQVQTQMAIGEYYLNSNNQKARSYFDKSLELAKLLDRQFDMASNYYSIGYCYYSEGDYEKSLDNYLRSIRIYETMNDGRRLANALLSVISVYTDYQKFDKAMEYYNKAITLIQSQRDSVLLCSMLAQRGNIFFAQGKYDSTLSYLNKEYEIALKINDTATIISTLGNIGLMLKKLNRTNEAITYTKKALDLVKLNTNMNDYLAVIYNNLGSIYTQKKQYDSAQVSFERSLFYCDIVGSSTVKMENYLNMAEMFGDMGQYKNQVLYLKKYHSLKDSLFTNKSTSQLIQLESDYQLEKKNLELVKKDNALIEQENQRNILWTILLSAFLLIAILIYFFRRIKRKKEELETLNQKINNQKNELEKLNEVKNRLFSIISHDLRNPLVTLRSYLLLSENDTIDASVKHGYKQKTLEAVTKTSELMDNLLLWAGLQIRKASLKIIPIQLADCIEDCIAMLQPQAELKNVHIKKGNVDMIGYGNPDILCMALRNLISNAIKFSHHGQVIDIQTIRKDECILLQVKDYGIGMNADQIQKINNYQSGTSSGTRGEKGAGLGLFLVKELLEEMHAELHIESVVGEGTTCSIQLAALSE